MARRMLNRSTFQSAPPVETRGDAVRCDKTAEAWDVSIRSPRRNEGRLNTSGGDTSLGSVSIRSPRRNEGRPVVVSKDPRSRTFQSAPPVETRGDLKLATIASGT